MTNEIPSPASLPELKTTLAKMRGKRDKIFDSGETELEEQGPNTFIRVPKNKEARKKYLKLQEKIKKLREFIAGFDADEEKPHINPTPAKTGSPDYYNTKKSAQAMDPTEVADTEKALKEALQEAKLSAQEFQQLKNRYFTLKEGGIKPGWLGSLSKEMKSLRKKLKPFEQILNKWGYEL